MKQMFIAAMFGSLAIAAPAVAQTTDISVVQRGAIPSASGPAANFIGHVVVDALLPSSVQTPASSGLVTFAPGARTAWHTHPAGQMLVVTGGKGWVQREGETRQDIRSGDVVWIPAGVKHWHGATDTTSMSHIAITYIRDGKTVDWMEQVTDEQYRR